MGVIYQRRYKALTVVRRDESPRPGSSIVGTNSSGSMTKQSTIDPSRTFQDVVNIQGFIRRPLRRQVMTER
jgi:hypothetical protein